MSGYPTPIFQNETILAPNQGTIAVVGTHTVLNVASLGLSSFLINMGSTATTIDVNAGAVGQTLRLEIKQGATPHAATLGSSVVFNATFASFTSTNTAAVVDMIDLVCAQSGTVWRVDNIVLDSTV